MESIFFVMIRRPPRSPLFPYPARFRAPSRHAQPEAQIKLTTTTTTAGTILIASSFRGSVSRRRRHHTSRSEEHTSELQYANISYAVFCLKKKKALFSYSDRKNTMS